MIDIGFMPVIGLFGHIGVSFHPFGTILCILFFMLCGSFPHWHSLKSDSTLPRCYAACMSGTVSWFSFAH